MAQVLSAQVLSAQVLSAQVLKAQVLETLSLFLSVKPTRRSSEAHRRLCSAPFRVTQGRFDERAEQAPVSRILLGVPLDTNRKPGARELNRLNCAVVGEADGVEPFPEPVHGLVVMASTVRFGAENRADSTGGLQDDPVGADASQCRSMGVVADYFREVLVQGAAEADVQQLEATADGEQRQVRS